MTTHKLGNQPKQLRPFNHSQKRGALLRKIAIYADELDKNQYPTTRENRLRHTRSARCMAQIAEKLAKLGWVD